MDADDRFAGLLINPLIPMLETKSNRTDARVKASVAVVYEDSQCREEAVKFCDVLVQRFWATHGFDISWSSFTNLQQSSAAADSADKAAKAALIVFATRPEGELPIDVVLWIQKWSSKRCDREGALVGLLDPVARNAMADDKHLYLRNLAHHAGMDYLTKMPENISRGLPDSLDSCSQRAQRVTSVLDEILHKQPVPQQPSLAPHR